MFESIKNKTIPKKLALNSKDILKIYDNNITEDFKTIDGEELEEIQKVIKDYNEAKNQEKRWKSKKNDAQEALSTFLKDNKVLKGVINGELKDLCKWQIRKGSQRIKGLSDIKKIDNKDDILDYLNKHELIYETEGSKSPSVLIKDLEV